jgi:hypothetical protein
LFGTATSGGDEYCGDFGCGTVYELTPPTQLGGAWTETTIHIFGETAGDGADSVAVLTVGPGGVLYGTTTAGGSGMCPRPEGGPEDGCGTVFTLTPATTPGGAWEESVIYSFTGLSGDGAYAAANAAVGKNGTLYGTTQYGGSTTSACPGSYYVLPGCGIVFELTPSTTPGGQWTETILHSFSGQDGDGAIPVAGLSLVRPAFSTAPPPPAGAQEKAPYLPSNRNRR